MQLSDKDIQIVKDYFSGQPAANCLQWNMYWDFGNGQVQSLNSAVTADFYFDPTSHLLIKSVCPVLMGAGHPVTFLSVVTYSDYRKVGTAMIPFRYTETLNGQLYRTLQLSGVQLSPDLTSQYFQF